MGEAKRRKQILGDLYGKSKYIIKLGDVVSTQESEIDLVAEEAKQLGIVDNGHAIPFALNIKNGGKLLGFGFPSIDTNKNLCVGLAVISVTDITIEEATPIYKSAENEIRREIGLLYKETLKGLLMQF